MGARNKSLLPNGTGIYAHVVGWGMAVPETVLTNKELEKAIIRENVLRVPEFFLQGITQSKFARTETARTTAGYAPRTIRDMIL